MPQLSIVLPAHNEEHRIGPTLRAIAEQSPSWPWTCEVVVVDDGSTDATLAVVEAHAAEIPSLTIVRHTVNRGKGAAVASSSLTTFSN